jgi:subfamily B ATP-binding cassette protein MsbA
MGTACPRFSSHPESQIYASLLALMNTYRRLYKFIRPYRGTLIFSMVLLVIFSILEAATTALSIPLFDKVLVKTGVPDTASIQRYISLFLSFFPGQIIAQISIALLFLTLVKGVSLYYSNYFMNRVGQGVVTDLRNELFRHVMRQSMAFFSLNSTGRLMSRMSGDVEQVQEAVSNVLADFFREIVVLVSLISLNLWIDWKLACVSLLVAPLMLSITLGMGKRIRSVSWKGREDAACLNDQLQQSITGMRIIKAFGMEQHEQQRFQKSSLRLFRSNMRAAAILFINSPLMEFLAVLAFIPLLNYAHLRIIHGSLSLGRLGGSLITLFRMYDPIRRLSRIHVQFQRASASGSRIVDLLDEHREIEDCPDARTLEGVFESIELRNVCFDYQDQQHTETPVLRDINLKVHRNQVIALVGSSGSGKTTLVGLIPRFYDPTSGSILIDGIDIREYTNNSLRKQIAIVTQETFLFNDTVRNNIAYGDVNASEEKIIEAARAALADEFILHLPMKYETMIGERGQRLSGGERQRISIARALLKNAPILILDEATSALDSESEKLVQQALANLIRDRTTFVIAHRLSTIREADMILVIDQGRIVESGTHESLMAQDGPYRKFFRLQTEEVYSSPPKAMEVEGQ